MVEIEYRNWVSGGHADSLVQASSVRDINVHNPVRLVRSAVGGTGGFGVRGFLYRCLASLLGCAALYGLPGGTPLTVLGRWCAWLSLPSGWTAPAARWIVVREGGLGQAAVLVLLIGLLTLPGPERVGRDLGEALRWRSPSTAVLAGAVLVQCRAGFWVLVPVLAAVGLGLWEAGRGPKGPDARWERAGVGVTALVLAVGFLPLCLLAAAVARDGGSGWEDG